MNNNKVAFGLIGGGLAGSLVAGIILSSLLKITGQYTTNPLLYLILLGLLISLFSIFIFKLKSFQIKETLWYNNNNFFRFVILTILFTSILYGIYIHKENIYISLFFLALIYSTGIWVNYYLLNSIQANKKLFAIIGGGIGGFFSGIIISLIYLIVINASIDEGYFVLLSFVLALIGSIFGLSISIALKTYEYSESKRSLSKSERAPIIFSLLLIFLSLLYFTSFNYWGNMELNKAGYTSDDENQTFKCNDLNSDPNKLPYSYSKNDIINFLENKFDKKIDTFAVLYLLSKDEKWSNEFKKIIIDDARNESYLGVSGSVKAWQYEVMLRAYYYDLISKDNPDIFKDAENDLILNWFKKINEGAYKTTWADHIYGFLFKRSPDGLYANQEIGAGMLSVLSDVLESKYPEISKENREYISEYGVGWKGNFRNPDDGIVYHQHVWMKNAYMMANFGGQEDYLFSNNSRNSFEWVLLQWPPNGISLAYNSPLTYTPFDIMTLGAHLFDDGRYLWLSNNMLKNDMMRQDLNMDHNVGLEYWDETLIPVVPKTGSCYLSGTTGIASNPGPLKSDKIVLREGWNEDSLFALLNLRFSGWHSYKATNSFISVMYGEPFVVEKLELKNHSWLPKGKADHRDKKIDRTELNGFQIEKKGLQKIIYQITGLGNEWAQDPPRFAEVLTFNSTPIADYSITKISDWHGWDNTRTSVMVKGNDSFIVVFDQNKGKSDDKVAVNWHLKGEAEIGDQYVKLTNNNHSMNVHFPHNEKDYNVEIHPTEYLYPPAGEIHNADYDIYMTSENKYEVGFITLFYPNKGNGTYEIKNIDIIDSDKKSGYTDALGINITKLGETFIIGKGKGNYLNKYDGIETDADIFVMHKNYGSIEFAFSNATIFNIISDRNPSIVEENGNMLVKNSDWQYSNEKILLNISIINGYIKIKF